MSTPWLEPGAGLLADGLKEAGVAPAHAEQVAASISIAISVKRVADEMVAIMRDAGAILAEERAKDAAENKKGR